MLQTPSSVIRHMSAFKVEKEDIEDIEFYELNSIEPESGSSLSNNIVIVVVVVVVGLVVIAIVVTAAIYKLKKNGQTEQTD